MTRLDWHDEISGQLELSTDERQLLAEAPLVLRRIRFGSVVLTVHEGHIVEISKTERIRCSPS